MYTNIIYAYRSLSAQLKITTTKTTIHQEWLFRALLEYRIIFEKKTQQQQKERKKTENM